MEVKHGRNCPACLRLKQGHNCPVCLILKHGGCCPVWDLSGWGDCTICLNLWNIRTAHLFLWKLSMGAAVLFELEVLGNSHMSKLEVCEVHVLSVWDWMKCVRWLSYLPELEVYGVTVLFEQLGNCPICLLCKWLSYFYEIEVCEVTVYLSELEVGEITVLFVWAWNVWGNFLFELEMCEATVLFVLAWNVWDDCPTCLNLKCVGWLSCLSELEVCEVTPVWIGWGDCPACLSLKWVR